MPGLGAGGCRSAATSRRYPPLAPQPKPQHAITVAVSSRALFDLVEERRIYEEQGVEKYVEYQQKNENVTLKPGPAFYFVKVPGPGRAGRGDPPCGGRAADAEDAARPHIGKRRSPTPPWAEIILPGETFRALVPPARSSPWLGARHPLRMSLRSPGLAALYRRLPPALMLSACGRARNCCRLRQPSCTRGIAFVTSGPQLHG